MVPLPSFGDIVSAANIALSIYNALSESTGSSYEYQSLIEELRSFVRALRVVDYTIAMTPQSGCLAQDIAAETMTCLDLLKAFHDRVKSYQKALGRGGKRAFWRKIRWALVMAKEVASFREKLSQHKQN